MKIFLYTEFFRAFVLRKKQELVNPRFIPLSEICLPKFSLFHYLPRHINEYGPPANEAFISNFPKEVFVDFKLDFDPVLGNGHAVAFDKLKAIKAYRGSHYNYNWTRNISSVYNRENVLVVENYGLMEKAWAYRPSLFMQYEQYYNRYRNLFLEINKQAEIGKRQQFMRIDLPINVPGWKALQEDYRHFVSSMKDGVPVPNRQMIRMTKAENSYWLLDWYALLMGDKQNSLFNLLTPAALKDLHIIFTFNSKSLIVNLGLLVSWFDELKKPAQRENATKRFYLALMNLSRGGISEAEIVDDSKGDIKDEVQPKKSGSGLDQEEEDEKSISVPANEPEDVSGASQSTDAPAAPSSILDIFADVETPSVDDVGDQGETGSTGDAESVEDWTSEVDDTLLEEEKVEEVGVVKKQIFTSPDVGIELALAERAREGSLSVAEQQFFMKKAASYQTIKMDNGQTLEEFIKIDENAIKGLKDDAKIQGEFVTILDESMLTSRAAVLKKTYAKKFMHKDIARSILSIQNAGIALTDLKHERIVNVEGAYEVYKLQVHPVDGSQSTRVIRIPAVDNDGNFRVDGVKQHLQLQRMELPIRKISESKVALTSFYDKKLMVSRSAKVVDDYGRWLIKQILLQGKEKKLTYRMGNVYDKFMPSPRMYSLLAKRFQEITVGDYHFNFNYHQMVEKYPDFAKYKKADQFLVGIKDNQPLWVDDFGNVYQNEEMKGSIEDLLGISTAGSPIEFCVININGYLFPIGVVLCYYFGIDALLKALKATTRTVPMGNRPQLTADEFAIAFSDEYLILNRRERMVSLIFGGMVKLNNIGNFSRVDLNNKGVWVPLMGDPKVRPQHFNEMKLIFDMFIDPMTRDKLQEMGYSTEMHYLLIDAVKLLTNDFTRHEVELEEQRIVGYERFAGHIYSEICRSTRQYRNKGNDRKHTFDLNPEAVIMNIITDTSVNLVEEVNPFHQMKDQEEVTFGGTKGRGEVSMVKRTRGQLRSYKGIISEANKDSGKVGYITYLTSDPRITDYRGNIELKGKNTNTGLGSCIMNLQYGGTLDDPKRVSFASNQASQAVSAENYSFNILRTGYENVVAHRTSELYSKVAKQDGKVTKVTDEIIQVTYKDGSSDNYPLGLVIGEAAGEFHRHTRVTDLAEGDTFKAGEVLGWDKQWFERDPFCPGQVANKCGRMTRLALVEDQTVFEDSLAMSYKLANEFITPYIKNKSFLIGLDQTLRMRVKVGDEVDYDSILCDVEDADLDAIEDSNDLMENINRLGVRQVKSHHHGKVVKIEVVYNGQVEEMSASVKDFIGKADKERARLAKLSGSDIVTGNVASNMNVKKQAIMPGKAKIMVYIEAMDPSVTADKYVVGNQMKGTVGNIFHHPMTTVDGREILLKFSFKSLFNRMVLSLRNKLAMNELAIHMTKKAVDIYRGRA